MDSVNQYMNYYAFSLSKLKMAGNFRSAITAAGLSITTNEDGTRKFGGNAHMDREESGTYRGTYDYRGRSRGRSRWRGGSRYNNRPGGRFRRTVSPLSRFEDDNDEDGDTAMQGGFQSQSRYKPYGRRPNYNRGNYRQNRFDDKQSFDSKWFKVTMPGARNHDKNWLISKLKNQVNLPFECVDFHCFGDSACFFVDDKEVADALKSKSHRITTRDGNKVIILVRPSGPPKNVNSREGGLSDTPLKVLDAETEHILMNCLAQRFVTESNSINLSKLAEDTNDRKRQMDSFFETFVSFSALSSSNIQGNLNKQWLTSAFIGIIHKIRPALAGLDLSGNRLRNLDVLRDIPGKLPQLQILSLKDNEIQSLEDLERLKSIESLKHLFVEGNPFCAKYKGNTESLKRDVRNKLPTVETLDGMKLPPPIVFDVPSTASLVPSKVNYVPTPAVQAAISQFVQEYFQVYDRDDRQGLLDFYHDQATFSMCVNTYVRHKDFGRERQPVLNDYFPFSRNLKRLTDKGKRSSLIKHTKLAAVAFLTELPKSKHNLPSFALDVNMETPSFVCFTVRGHFLEGEARDVPRSFSRTFIILPSSDKRMRIVNDQLHIRNPVKDSVQNEGTSTATSVAPQQTTGSLTAEQKELVKKFSEASKMNLYFSQQCLQENNWDFKKAGEVFTNLQREGKIPAKAFEN